MLRRCCAGTQAGTDGGRPEDDRLHPAGSKTAVSNRTMGRKRGPLWSRLQAGAIPSSLRAFRWAIFSLVAPGRSTVRIQSAPALALAMG